MGETSPESGGQKPIASVPEFNGTPEENARYRDIRANLVPQANALGAKVDIRSDAVSFMAKGVDGSNSTIFITGETFSERLSNLANLVNNARAQEGVVSVACMHKGINNGSVAIAIDDRGNPALKLTIDGKSMIVGGNRTDVTQLLRVDMWENRQSFDVHRPEASSISMNAGEATLSGAALAKLDQFVGQATALRKQKTTNENLDKLAAKDALNSFSGL